MSGCRRSPEEIASMLARARAGESWGSIGADYYPASRDRKSAGRAAYTLFVRHATEEDVAARTAVTGGARNHDLAALPQAAPPSAVLDAAALAHTSRAGPTQPKPRTHREGEDNGAPPRSAARGAGVRICALDGCVRPVPVGGSGVYCGHVCANEARRRSRQSAAGSVAEQRQAPPGRPRFRLIFDPAIVIRPDRPAPTRRYADGSPALFRDDLNAIADHGLPGMPARSDTGWAGASALMGAM